MQPNKDLQEVLGELFGFSDVVDFFKEFGQDLSPTDNEKGRPGRENWQLKLINLFSKVVFIVMLPYHW